VGWTQSPICWRDAPGSPAARLGVRCGLDGASLGLPTSNPATARRRRVQGARSSLALPHLDGATSNLSRARRRRVLAQTGGLSLARCKGVFPHGQDTSRQLPARPGATWRGFLPSSGGFPGFTMLALAFPGGRSTIAVGVHGSGHFATVIGVMTRHGDQAQINCTSWIAPRLITGARHGFHLL
jgi:hypothetical protein